MRNQILELRHLASFPKSAFLLAASIPLGLLASCGSDGSSREDSTAAEAQAFAAGPDAGEGSGAASLPENFPEEFPMPSNLRLTQGTFTEGSYTTQANHLVRGTSTMGVEEIADFYRTRLPEAGYDIQQADIMGGGTYAMIYFHSDRFKDATVQLRSSDGATDVLINLPLRD